MPQYRYQVGSDPYYSLLGRRARDTITPGSDASLGTDPYNIGQYLGQFSQQYADDGGAYSVVDDTGLGRYLATNRGADINENWLASNLQNGSVQDGYLNFDIPTGADWQDMLGAAMFAAPLAWSAMGVAGGAAPSAELEAAGAFGGEALGAAANSAGAFGGSVAPWAAGAGASSGLNLSGYGEAFSGMQDVLSMYNPTDLSQMYQFAESVGMTPQELANNGIFDFANNTLTPEAITQGVGNANPLAGVYSHVDPGIGSALDTGGIDWSEVASGWEGNMAESANQAMNMNVPLERLKTLLSSPTAFRTGLQDMFGNRKDPLALLGALRSIMNQKDVEKMYNNSLSNFQQQGFPHQQYHGLANDWLTDPAKRYEMLKGTPGFMESQRYAEDAQRRRNARAGYLNAGYGDQLITNALASNAQTWDSQLFNQLAEASGMKFNNMSAQAQLAGGFLPAITQGRNQRDQSIFEALRNNQGFLPEIFKTSLD